ERAAPESDPFPEPPQPSARTRPPLPRRARPSIAPSCPLHLLPSKRGRPAWRAPAATDGSTLAVSAPGSHGKRAPFDCRSLATGRSRLRLWPDPHQPPVLSQIPVVPLDAPGLVQPAPDRHGIHFHHVPIDDPGILELAGARVQRVLVEPRAAPEEQADAGF